MKSMDEVVAERFPETTMVGALARARLAEGPVGRRFICERCDADAKRNCWICSDCEASFRAEVAMGHVERMLASIPVRYRDTDFFNICSRGVSAAQADAVFDSDAQTILLMGPAGAGKTSLAVARLKVHNPGGKLFVDAYELARARAMHPLGDGEAPLADRAIRTRTIVLDDVGAEKQDISGTVGEVIFCRHAGERRTIVTTGLTEQMLRDRYGAGVHRRLFEDATVIQLGGVAAKETGT